MNTVRKDSAVHVSLSSYLVVKQQSLVKQNRLINQKSLINPATRLRPAPKRPLPGYLNRVVFRPEELERNDPRRPPKAALETLPSL
jgi:hypothetical protein